MHLHWLYLKNDLMLKNKVILLLVVYLIPFVLFAQTSRMIWSLKWEEGSTLETFLVPL